MYQAIAGMGTVLLLMSLAVAASAQSQPVGSASALEGLQERTIQRSHTSPNSPILLKSNRSASETDFLPSFLQNFKFDVSTEKGQLQTGVFPVENTSQGNRVQVLYQLDNLLNNSRR
jgi:prephenate dehydratase